MLSEQELIAPCGMNCRICLGFIREKNKCEGCRGSNENKPNQCVTCRVVNCEILQNSESGFCYECEKLPCARLKQLDKRYSTKYNMSMLENLESIKTVGIEQFVKNEKERWKCEVCGGTICVHYALCLTCNDRKKVKRK